MKALFELAAVAVGAVAVAVLIVGFVFSAVRFLYRSLRGQGLAAYLAFRRELGKTLLLSFALTLELTGRWPWQGGEEAPDEWRSARDAFGRTTRPVRAEVRVFLAGDSD